MSNTSPEVGKTYTIDHAWNGRYTVVVTGIRNDWLTIQITDRRARALVPMNERSEGDHLTAHAADGHAIAEAPDLLAALDEAYGELLADSHRDGPRCLLLTTIEEALAKARGAA